MGQNQTNEPYAFIVGLSTIQGLQAARILAERHVPVVGIADTPKHFASRTNVCEKIYYANTTTEECINLLVEIGQGLRKKAVIIPCRDEVVLLVAANRERLADFYHIALPGHQTVEMLMNKSHFYKYAHNENFPIPKTFFVHSENELMECSRKISYPCVLKPPGRSQAWTDNSSYKAYKVFSQQDLLAIYEKSKMWCNPHIVQEWAEGKEGDLHSCYCYFDSNSEPLVTFVSRKIRQYLPQVGESSLAVECQNDEVREIAVKLFRHVGLKGLACLELKRNPVTGKLFIIEPNIGRATVRSPICEAGGVELLYTMYCDLVGKPLPEMRTQKFTNIKWIHLTRDCASAFHYWRKGELSFRSWLESVKGPKKFAVLSLKDPMPFVWDVMRAVKMLTSKTERQRRLGAYKTPQKTFRGAV